LKLLDSAHTSQPWLIHEIAPEFDLQDVWALPTPGGSGDFPRLVEWGASLDPARSSSVVVRGLFAARWKLGALFGWDGSQADGVDQISLRDRLPPHLRDVSPDLRFDASPFTPLYRTDDEFAAEIINRTVHGVLHLGWVREQGGGYRGQMAILVKRNGLLGTAYMAAISPFRRLFSHQQGVDQERGAPGWR
jgi:hypothetical protein